MTTQSLLPTCIQHPDVPIADLPRLKFSIFFAPELDVALPLVMLNLAADPAKFPLELSFCQGVLAPTTSGGALSTKLELPSLPESDFASASPT